MIKAYSKYSIQLAIVLRHFPGSTICCTQVLLEKKKTLSALRTRQNTPEHSTTSAAVVLLCVRKSLKKRVRRCQTFDVHIVRYLFNCVRRVICLRFSTYLLCFFRRVLNLRPTDATCRSRGLKSFRLGFR